MLLYSSGLPALPPKVVALAAESQNVWGDAPHLEVYIRAHSANIKIVVWPDHPHFAGPGPVHRCGVL